MNLCIVLLCCVAAVFSQTTNNNGNPTGEIGSPAFDEIVVESTLTVRGKSGSRSGKSLSTNVSSTTAKPNVTEPAKNVTEPAAIVDGASVTLKRTKRVPRQRYGPGRYPNHGQFGHFPSSSSSAAQASSNAFNSHTPFGSFGAAASQSSSQSHNFGPGGFQGAAGHSASQTYNLPNGNQIGVSFSNGYSFDNGRPSFSNSQAITLTRPNGEKQHLYGNKG